MNTTVVKNNKLILGTERPDPTVLKLLRGRLKPGQRWICYQNVALDSADLGRLTFLCVGPGCTYAEPPERMPDSYVGVGWRFVLVGVVNLETGEIETL